LSRKEFRFIMEAKYRKRLNNAILQVLRQALRISLYDPSMALFLLKTLFRQKKAARIRENWEERGIHVPPFMIASVTRQCNLNCTGCYAHAQQRINHREMSSARFNELMDEARELGFAFALLAGGEPLTRPNILDTTETHPQIIFPLFTNGLLLSDPMLDRLGKQKNVIPVLSLEGYEQETDARRGQGVYGNLLRAMKAMKARRMFFGISLTVTRSNFQLVTSESFVHQLVKDGCRLFFFVEYIPVKESTEDMVISSSQREGLELRMRELRRTFNRVFISFPGDEQSYGGCLAAGRGFVHVSPDGGLEPCPFAPYSDTNLEHSSLKQGLASVFLNGIRESDEHLEETEGGCALWNKRDWVQSLLLKSRTKIA